MTDLLVLSVACVGLFSADIWSWCLLLVNSIKPFSFESRGWEGSLPAAKKLFPKSNIYAMRGTMVGIVHPFMGQRLQGKQTVWSGCLQP